MIWLPSSGIEPQQCSSARRLELSPITGLYVFCNSIFVTEKIFAFRKVVERLYTAGGEKNTQKGLDFSIFLAI